jgi:hypothetical protein
VSAKIVLCRELFSPENVRHITCTTQKVGTSAMRLREKIIDTPEWLGDNCGHEVINNVLAPGFDEQSECYEEARGN